MKTQRLCFNLQSICSFGNSLSFRCISPSVTPFVRSSLHSKSSLHSQSFTFGSFLLAVSSLIINSIQSVFTPQVHSFTQSFPLVCHSSFIQLIQELHSFLGRSFPSVSPSVHSTKVSFTLPFLPFGQSLSVAIITFPLVRFLPIAPSQGRSLCSLLKYSSSRHSVQVPWSNI